MSGILAITGVTGKSGSVFAQILYEHIESVYSLFPGGIRVLVRNGSDTARLDASPIHFEKHIGDLQDVEYLRTALAGVDTLIHIAGIHTSKKVVQAAATCHVRRLVAIHTTGIFSKYKTAGEEYRKIDKFVYKTCRESGIVLTILRPAMIYGNTKDRNVSVFIRIVDKLPIVPVVRQARYKLQPVHYKDLGIAYYQVLMNEGTTANRDFNMSGGEPISLRRILIEISNNLGKKIRFINVPFIVAYGGAWFVYIFTIGRKDYREKVQRLCEERVFSYEEAATAFDYSPMTFRDGIVNEVKEYLEAKGNLL